MRIENFKMDENHKKLFVCASIAVKEVKAEQVALQCCKGIFNFLTLLQFKALVTFSSIDTDNCLPRPL